MRKKHPKYSGWNFARRVFPVFGSLAFALTARAVTPISVMPLGDSITYGASQPANVAGGYRAPLLALLTNAGYRIQFVGSDANNSTAALTASGNAAHEGHGGYTTSNLLNNLDANAGTSGNNGGFWLTGITNSRPAIFPEVVLVMAGVNDLGVNQYSPTQGLEGLNSLLNKLTTMRSNAYIIVSTLTPYIGVIYTNREANQQIFNAALPDLVAAHTSAGHRVTMCDVRPYVPLTNAAALLCSDGVHPNQEGYNQIAQMWFEAFQKLPFTDRLQPYGGTPVSGYQLAWSDEFDAHALDTNKWVYRTDSKHWSTQLPANIAISNGLLHLALRKETVGGMDYTGAGLISKPEFRYGYYEARMRTPPGRGWHTSFWMMRHDGSGGTDPAATTNELDCIENDSINPLSYSVTTHKWNPLPHVAYGNQTVATSSLTTNFHVFGCELTPANVKYYFDGALVKSVDATQFPHGDMNIWLTSIASYLGGTTNVDDALLPSEAQFDYARYFSKEIYVPFVGEPTHQATISFPFYDRTEALTGFPALVVLGPGVPGFDYSTFASTNGSDLGFWTADGSTYLPHEIEKWNTNGSSHVWVRLPVLTNGVSVLARWGDPLATNPPPVGDVWSGGYVGVWHFASSNITDSSGLGHNAAANSSAATNGLVAYGAQFDGTNATAQVPFASDLNLPTNFEVQGWFKVAASNKPSAGNYLVLTVKQVDFNNRNWWLSIRSDGRLWWKSSPSLDVTNTTDICDGVWHHVAAVHDGTTGRLYIDGSLAATDTTPGTAATQSSPVYIGSEAGIRYFAGDLDEFRLSSVTRSSNRVWATWLNISSNASSVSIGGVTNLPPTAGFPLFALQIPDAGQRGPRDDPDGDGYANLLEYVTGGTPTNADTIASMSGTRLGGLLALQFTRTSNSVDATLIVEGASATTNDVNWNGIATNIGGSWGSATNVIETNGPALFNVTAFDTDPATNRFLRLRITRP